MSSETIHGPSEYRRGQPAWEVATLFPAQGAWTEAEYFALETSRFVELADGCLEVLPMPTWLHQLIVKFLVRELDNYLARYPGGTVLFAPVPVRLFPGTIREPDVLYVRPENAPDNPHGYPKAVDLVMEVVSDGPADRKRDLQDKRADYAKAGVEEYWIVDPHERRITVLALDGNQYSEHGVFTDGDATSAMLSDFTLSVAATFAFLDAESQ